MILRVLSKQNDSMMPSSDWSGSDHLLTKHHHRELGGPCKATTALQVPTMTGTRTRYVCESSDTPFIKVKKIYARRTGTGYHCLDFGGVWWWTLQGWVTQRRATCICLTERPCPADPRCWCPRLPWAREPRDTVIFHLHRSRLMALITLCGLHWSNTPAVSS